ncbi:MAG: DUF4097 family beta strand repeat-containing protein, partial [Candidatus Binatia bacterium]
MKISQGKIRALSITTALICIMSAAVAAQDSLPGMIDVGPRQDGPRVPSPSSRIKLPKKEWSSVAQPEAPVIMHFDGGTFEKSIAVDPRISVSLCVTQGDVKINGWSRNEVRVFVKDGSKIGFNTLQKGRQNEKPVWIKIVGVDPDKPGQQRSCLWGDEVEIDVPTGASINMEGKATRTIVDSVRKVAINNAGGDISIRNVSEGVDATTYQGDVDVENSDGMITLNTTSGNILAFELSPSEVGDIFKARSNSGRIALQNLEHRQVDVNSISGSVLFSGELLAGGVYDIRTTNGSLTLNIPANSPCFLSATYMEGNFSSELPLKLMTENLTPGPVKTLKG